MPHHFFCSPASLESTDVSNCMQMKDWTLRVRESKRRQAKWLIIREKRKFLSTKETRGITLARYAQTSSLQCSVKSGFTIMLNKRALHIISTSCVLHRHALASKALPEYLKIVLNTQLNEWVLSGHVFFKVLYKDELIDLQR